MDNLNLLKFEQQSKMTKPGGGNISTLLETSSLVKFKEFIYTPNEKEKFHITSTSFEQTSQIPVEDSSMIGQQFFKDPLGQIEQDHHINNDSEQKPHKLGHSMRASVGQSTRMHHKTQLDVMNERNSLLEKMKQQREAYSKREMAKEDATVLVNRLLAHGFQISPPSDSPRFECATPMTTATADIIPVGNNSEMEIVRSIHKELKRVRGYSQSSQ